MLQKKIKINNDVFADLHTHILPEMDDGAESVNDAIKLLREEERQGITHVALTPHFHLAKEEIEQFLLRRQRSYEILCSKIVETGMAKDLKLLLGAEVRYDSNLAHIDCRKLCIANSSYLLLEPPGNYPFDFEQTVYGLLVQGITPIIAHIERYPFLYEKTSLMEEFLDDGILFHANAGSLFSRHYGSTVKKLAKKGYISFLASDTHNLDVRPPMLEDALRKLKKHAPEFVANSAGVVNNISF